MKNLSHFSFSLILFPQIFFFNWQNNSLAVNSKSQDKITTAQYSKTSNFYRAGRKVYNVAQNPYNYQESKVVNGTTTNLKSTTDRMLSYRHQRHTWITNDGAIHVLFNQGQNQYDASSLVLYSSFDDGKSWNWMLSIPNTSSESTADGFLVRQKLFLAYSSATGGIIFLPITYNLIKKKWKAGQTNTVYQARNFVATSPTITVNNRGNLWTAFIAQQNYTKNYSIKVFNGGNRGLNWDYTYVNLGIIDESARKSARLVALKDRIGVVYTNDDTFYWAYKIDSFFFNTPWQSQSIFTYQPGSNNSLYSSHFSLVSDSLDNIHLATHDLGKLIYLKFDGQNQTWNPKKILSDDVRVGYMQTSLSADNKLLITYNQLTQVGVFESCNYGESFNFINLFVPPEQSDFPDSNVSFEAPRIIAPAAVNYKLPVLQQFQIDGEYGSIYYNLQLTNIDSNS
ncbi:MAG: hypothetical protein KME01_04595 [Chroococcus sp. CMT-3BRIN-NPC107]|jgi:hypothetical protein|nr:hypothetical protein [Chroococcus sp. CMT-3BRIN-NPC107]